ncbi:MAG: T9SS type A sorting domain-containing protein, partial [Bacteroidota bacterium]
QLGDVITLSASSSSGLEVSFSIEGPAILSGNQVEGTDIGTVTITASQVGDENYNAAENVIRPFEVTNEEVLGIDEVNAIIYPNPVIDVLNINSDLPVDLKIFDLKGSVLLKKDQVQGTVDLQWLKQGTYILELKSESEIQKTRIQKIN